MEGHGWDHPGEDAADDGAGQYPEVPLGDSYDDAQWDLSQAASAESDAAWYASEASDDLDNAGS